MDNAQGAATADETFCYSSKSQLGKSRRWIWVGLGIGLMISAISNKTSVSGLLLSAGFVLFLGIVIDWFIRRQLRPGRPLVTLTREVIESPIFSGKLKRYPWKDIAAVSVEAHSNGQWIKLLLAESSGVQNKRSFWTGRNDAQPLIPISHFESETQERLLGAIQHRIQRYKEDAGESYQVPVNSLTAAREFQERLKSFAPIPWLTYSIIAINVVVWIFTLTKGASTIQAPVDKLLAWGGNAASEVQRGEAWRLLTATFLHSGLMHLLMNMIGLASAGITVERIYGHRLFILIYLGSGLIGSALSLHYSAQHAVSVGASGAVFGVTGALFVAVLQHRDRLPQTFSKQTLGSLGFFIVYALMQGFAKQGIDNAAHVGGLLGGCLLAYVLPERFDMENFVRNIKQRTSVAAIIVIAATTGLTAMAPQAAIDQRMAHEGLAAFSRGMQSFDAAVKGLRQDQQDLSAGKMSERQADERTRTVHAPAFRVALRDLIQAQADLPSSDQRLPLLTETKRLTELLVESLGMDSVFEPGSEKPKPADPARMTAIETEMKEVGEKLQRLVKEASSISVRHNPEQGMPRP